MSRQSGGSTKWGALTLAFGMLAAACSGSSGESESTEVAATPAPVSTVARTTPPPTEPAVTEPAVTEPAVTEPEQPVDSAVATDAATTTVATTTTTTTVPPDPPPPNDQFADLSLGFDQVVDVRLPTAVTWRPGDDAMFVATQDGFVYRVTPGEPFETVLDFSQEVSEYAPGSERGLLGLAFDPRDDRMFINYTDLDHNTHVASYEVVDNVTDLSTRRNVLFLEQPGLGHNGGRLLFEENGNLFISSGDGGGSNGRDAQDVTNVFGALLRVIPKLDGDGYDIPPDNPFADGVADRPEIYARGFRNPWTFSIDDDTGDIWIGDVGNEEREEIDLIPGGTSGQNFGWYWFEGNNQRRNDFPEGLTPPVFDYGRSDGVAVMGGHVYRGDAIPALRGAYLFADLTGPVWAIGAAGVSRLDAERIAPISGWAEDRDGELYLLGIDAGVMRLVAR